MLNILSVIKNQLYNSALLNITWTIERSRQVNGKMASSIISQYKWSIKEG